jgi:hypothetical protein
LWGVWFGAILLILLEYSVEFMEQFWLALLVSVIAPAIMAFITNWNARAMKRMDYERQDAIEARAENSRKVMLDAQKAALNTGIVTLAVVEASQQKLDEMEAKIDQQAENNHAPPNSN